MKYLYSIFRRIEHFTFEEFVLLTVVFVAIGFVCLRGFGSRSNY